MKRILPLAFTLLSTGCAYYSPAPVYYRPYEVQREVVMETGTVQSVRSVLLQAPPTGAGAVTGSIVGGIAGHAIGHGFHHDTGAATVIGALVGGLIGSGIEADQSQRQGVEILVRMDDGRMVAYIQEANPDWFQPGDRVRVINDAYGPRLSR